MPSIFATSSDKTFEAEPEDSTVCLLIIFLLLAGVAGFEPTHDGIKTRCLTAWLHPIILSKLIMVNIVKVHKKVSPFTWNFF